MKVLAWYPAPPPSELLFVNLSKLSKGFPSSFLRFYRSHNGGEAVIDRKSDPKSLSEELDRICLHSIERIVDQSSDRFCAQHFPGLLIFGGNAATILIAFDTKTSKEWPVVVLRADQYPYIETTEPLCHNFAELLGKIQAS
jgi:hypothetical protein